MPARALDPIAYYRSLFEACAVAYIVGDCQGRAIDCNPAAATLFACQTSDLIGRRLIDWSPTQQPDGRPSSEHVRTLLARVNAGEIAHCEWQCVRLDGKLINIALNVRQMLIANLPHHLVTCTDITNYKRSEQEADQARALLQTAIEQSPSAILIADAPDVRIRFANSAALSMREATRKKLTDIDVSQHILNWQPLHLDGTPYPAEELPLSRAVLRGELTHGEELLIRDEDGVDHWAVANASPVIRNGKVVAGIVVFHDISVQKAHERQLERLAHYDALTGLPNRALLADRLHQAVEQARRNQQRMALILLDLDGFKWINDTLGHEAGDELLCTLAQRLPAALRGEDTVARLGGDEFIILAQEIRDSDHARNIVNKLLARIQEPIVLQGRPYQISGSAGIALYPDDGQEARLLMRNADIAMYQAKAAGKNRSAFYAMDMQSTAMQRMELEDSLRRAAAQGFEREFMVHYQPIVATVDGRSCGYEARLLWQHPQRGMLLAADFLDAAENGGLSSSIGLWIMRAALQQFNLWKAASTSVERIAFSLSARHYREPGLDQQIAGLLDEFRFPSSQLTLLVNELLCLDEQPEVKRNFQALQNMGIDFALSGFGTGRSSLTLLQSFPFGWLGLDETLVQQLPQQNASCQLVTAIIQLAHSLNHQVVAVGVSRQEQVDFLRQASCDYLTGPFYPQCFPAVL